MATLKTTICGLEFPNPVMTAAGPGSKDYELCRMAAEGGAGALVTKTVSTHAADVPRPCMSLTNSGFLNTEKWSELSPEHWVEHEYPRIKKLGLPVIVGVGYTSEQIEKIAPMIKPYADAIEMSVHYVGTSMEPMLAALRAAKKALDVPVFMKMSPHTDITEIAKACEKNGADGLVMINSVGPCMGIDLETGFPLMGSDTGYGWLTGRAIRPIAIRTIFDVSAVVNIPIIGVGGVADGKDAAEMLMAGAVAVQTCTEAILKGPGIYGKIAKQLGEFLDSHGYKDVSEIVGLTRKKLHERKLRDHVEVPVHDPERCTKCGLCKVSCVYEAITIDDVLRIDAEKCFGCGLCVSRCRPRALTIAY